MVIALLFLCATAVVGAGVAREFRMLRGVVEQAGVALAVALAMQMWLPFVLSALFGITAGPIIALSMSLVFAGLIGRTLPWRGFARLLVRAMQRGRWFTVLGVVVFGIIVQGLRVHCLLPTKEGLASAGASWEDQAFHTALASAFLWSDNLQRLEYPQFVGWPLGYPFLPDLLVATLGKLGATLSRGFVWSAGFAAAAFLLLSVALGRLWTGSARIAVLGLGLFVFAGGLGFMDFARELVNGVPWGEAILKYDYANDWALGLHFHNPLTGVLFPMRTSLLGMPLAFAAILLFYRGTATGISKLEVTGAGVLTGLLPLVHAHSALVAVWVMAFYMVLFAPRRDWLQIGMYCGVPLLLLALPQVMWTQKQLALSDPPFVRAHLLWMADGKGFVGWMIYWIHNTGLRLVLTGWALWLVPRGMKLLTLPFFLLLVLGNVVVFQPFVYDNIKLFIFADLAASMLIAWMLLRWWKRGWLVRFACVVLAASLTLSGVLSQWRELKVTPVLLDWEAIAFGQMVKDYTEPQSTVLSGSQINNPVSLVAGRQLVLGYHGGLTLHGIPVGERIAEVREIYEAGPRAAEWLAKYRVKWVLVGPAERLEFPQLREDRIKERSLGALEFGPYKLYEMRWSSARGE